MNLINIIRENHLVYLSVDQLANELSKLIGDAPNDIKLTINNFLHAGDLFLDDSGKVSISKDKGLFKAKLIVNKKGYGFAVVEGYPDFFIPYHEINSALDGDDCLVEITKKHEDNIEGRVVRVLKRNTTHIVGTYIVGKSKNVVFPDDAKFPQVRIFKQDTDNAQNNQKVWVEIDKSEVDTSNMKGKIIEVLGLANSPKAEQLSIIRSYNLNENFDPETLKQAKSINQTINPKIVQDRVDFTKSKIITIDGEDAKDLDDAISVESMQGGGFILTVHIADVSHYVTEGSALDKEAFKRGTSVYFPNQVIPMLPRELSNGICSLSEGKERLTLSVIIELDNDCNVIKSTIVEGVIKTIHRMTYTEVKGILEDDELLIEKFKDVHKEILDFQFISNKLSEKRIQRGEIRMNLPEPFVLENETGEIISIESRIQDESHRIIESLMVLCNECVAKRFFDLSLPFVYRVHEKPDEEKIAKLSALLKNMKIAHQLDDDGQNPMTYQRIINNIKDDPKERTLTKLILRTMMKAKYNPTCLGHFGLASEFYCHFTSPIRRYPDLMIHRVIKEFLHTKDKEDLKRKYKSIVSQASEQSSITEKNAEECERAVDDYKKALYMSKFIGDTFIGTISGVQEFGIFVELDNGIEGLVRTEYLPIDNYIYDDSKLSISGNKHHYTIGDSVKVIVSNVNIKYRQIDFDLAGSENMRTLQQFVTVGKNNKAKASANTISMTSVKNKNSNKSDKNKQATAKSSKSKSSYNDDKFPKSFKARKQANKNNKKSSQKSKKKR